jgi:CHASE2 domain-containing sensor protein
MPTMPVATKSIFSDPIRMARWSLALAMLLAWLIVRQIDTLAATIGTLGIALLYLGYVIDLQRDWFGFIPVLAATLAQPAASGFATPAPC